MTEVEQLRARVELLEANVSFLAQIIDTVARRRMGGKDPDLTDSVEAAVREFRKNIAKTRKEYSAS